MNTTDDVLNSTILDIENSEKRIPKINAQSKTFELTAYPSLTSNLSGWIGALLVRSILRELDINEHHLFKWRLENKYMQYLVLDHYAPGYMPKTISFSEVLNKANGANEIRELFKNGFFLKATLGHGSGRNKNFDRTTEFEELIRHSHEHYNHNEKWMLQQKLNLKSEFRVHTFCKDIIYGLTFKLSGELSFDNYDAENFVKEILEKLPGTILQGTLIGWDIGLAENNQYYVIETNLTGFHPEYARGFQTTGYVDDDTFGPIICAWLNNYFKINYKISIDAIERSLLTKFPFLGEFMCYITIFNNEYLVAAKNKTKDVPVIAILYLSESTSSIINKLITHFQLVKFADTYYIIVNTAYYPIAKDLYAGVDYIKILDENTLFTKDQYQLVKQLNYERRRKISCYHAARMVNEKSYLIF